jgi:hypothetical protein
MLCGGGGTWVQPAIMAAAAAIIEYLGMSNLA